MGAGGGWRASGRGRDMDAHRPTLRAAVLEDCAVEEEGRPQRLDPRDGGDEGPRLDVERKGRRQGLCRPLREINVNSPERPRRAPGAASGQRDGGSLNKRRPLAHQHECRSHDVARDGVPREGGKWWKVPPAGDKWGGVPPL